MAQGLPNPLGGINESNTYGRMAEESQDTEMASFRGLGPSELVTNRSQMRGGGFKGTLKHTQRKGSDIQILADNDEEEDDNPSSQLQQSNSVYEIHKILSSDSYTIGKNVSEYIESFFQQYKNVQESAEFLPQPMESV